MCCKVDFLKRHTICLNEVRNVVLPVLTYACVKSVITIVPTEWVALLTRIRELWVSEHCSKTDYPERFFLWYYSVPPISSGIQPQIRAHPLLYASL
jgi:hypothetical protein